MTIRPRSSSELVWQGPEQSDRPAGPALPGPEGWTTRPPEASSNLTAPSVPLFVLTKVQAVLSFTTAQVPAGLVWYSILLLVSLL